MSKVSQNTSDTHGCDTCKSDPGRLVEEIKIPVPFGYISGKYKENQFIKN